MLSQYVSANMTLILREKSTLMQLRLQKASRDPSAKNHANLAEEYDKLFTSEARKVISYFGDHKIMEGAEAKQLLSKIFEVIPQNSVHVIVYVPHLFADISPHYFT